MKLQTLSLFRYSIPLRRTFAAGLSYINHREGINLIGTTDTGLSGCGEIAPLPGFSPDRLDEIVEVLRQLKGVLLGSRLPESLPALEEFILENIFLFDPYPSLVFGVEMILGDLASQAQGNSLAQWIHAGAAESIPVNAVLGDQEESFLDELAQKLRSSYPAFKLKIGRTTLEDDIKRIKGVSEIIGNRASLRLDANRAYDLRQAVRLFRELTELRIEYIEEPLTSGLSEDLTKLHEMTGVSIALDESIVDLHAGHQGPLLPEGIGQKLTGQAVDVMILKPTAVGGICRCLDLAGWAQRNGKRVVISSCLETGIGIAAALHLAAALHNICLPCGLDTIGLLTEPLIEEQLSVTKGHLRLPTGTGMGVTIRSPENLSFLEALRI